MEAAGATDVGAARGLVLHLVRILKIRVKPGANVVGALEPIDIGGIVPLRVPIVLRLKTADRNENRKSVNRHGWQATLLQLSVLRQSRSVQTRNVQQGPAVVLVLSHLAARSSVSRIAEIGVGHQTCAEHVSRGNGPAENMGPSVPGGGIAVLQVRA